MTTDRSDHVDRRGPRTTDRDGRNYEERTRVRWMPRPGSRVALVVAASLLVLAAYFMLAPVFMETSNGWFPCGSALSGPEDEFTANTCRNATDAHLAKALAAVALAVVVGVGGLVSFGGDRTTEIRREPRRLDDHIDDAQRREKHPTRASRGRNGADGERSPSRRPVQRSRGGVERGRDHWTDEGWD